MLPIISSVAAKDAGKSIIDWLRGAVRCWRRPLTACDAVLGLAAMAASTASAMSGPTAAPPLILETDRRMSQWLAPAEVACYILHHIPAFMMGIPPHSLPLMCTSSPALLCICLHRLLSQDQVRSGSSAGWHVSSSRSLTLPCGHIGA